MKYMLIFLLLINPFNYVADMNRLQKEADQAFQKKDYLMVILKYNHLINSYSIEDEEVLLNLANAYFQIQKQDQATHYYLQAIKIGSQNTKSMALNQLACIEYANQNYEEALTLFKEAVLNNPLNYKARYNFELMKKKLKKSPKNPQNSNPKPELKDNPLDTQNQSPSEKLKKQNEIQQKESLRNSEQKELGEEQASKGEKKDVTGNQKSLQPRKLEEIKLNKEKAEAILEALKNQEIQYIQQLKRSQNPASQRTYSGKKW